MLPVRLELTQHTIFEIAASFQLGYRSMIWLPCLGLNQDSSRSKREMLPVTPQGNEWMPGQGLNLYLRFQRTVTCLFVHPAMNKWLPW